MTFSIRLLTLETVNFFFASFTISRASLMEDASLVSSARRPCRGGHVVRQSLEGPSFPRHQSLPFLFLEFRSLLLSKSPPFPRQCQRVHPSREALPCVQEDLPIRSPFYSSLTKFHKA